MGFKKLQKYWHAVLVASGIRRNLGKKFICVMLVPGGSLDVGTSPANDTPGWSDKLHVFEFM